MRGAWCVATQLMGHSQVSGEVRRGEMVAGRVRKRRGAHSRAPVSSRSCLPKRTNSVDISRTLCRQRSPQSPLHSTARGHSKVQRSWWEVTAGTLSRKLLRPSSRWHSPTGSVPSPPLIYSVLPVLLLVPLSPRSYLYSPERPCLAMPICPPHRGHPLEHSCARRSVGG